MQYSNERIRYLLEAYSGHTSTDMEEKELFDWIDETKDTQPLRDFLLQLTGNDALPERYQNIDSAAMLARIRRRTGLEKETAKVIHRVHFLKTAWFRYAAAIIIITGVSVYLWNNKQTPRQPSTATTVPVENDIAPGGQRAVLTLADGSIIVLDSAANGQLAMQQGSVVKKEGEKIIYDASGNEGEKLTYNTMSTPRGGQYQLTLPDGTRVWLNAESSISYPVAFTGKTREVKITGELYFEVVKNKGKPFIVKTAKETITVLGTSFNVNVYPDEPASKTSLLQGSVKIGDKILKPGQAFVQGKIIPTDVEQDVAWKNGVFNFNNVSVQQVMRQLSRWYDINIHYEGRMPDGELAGEISRNISLSSVVELLDGVGVDLRLKGRTLHVKSR